MSAPINTGGPAFPLHPGVVPHPTFNVEKHRQGMTLRDWFAAQALTMPIVNDAQGSEWAEHIAQGAYKVADAMIAEREKGAKS